MVESRVKQLRDLLEDAIANGDDDQIEIIKQELFTINPNYVKDFGHGGSVTETKPMRMRSGGAAKRGYGKARR